MIKACVIGSPIAHSRSPLIHGYWLKQMKIDGLYTRELVHPSELRSFIARLGENGFAGCNVTLPHKEAALSAVDSVEKNVKSVGSVNTIYIRGGKTFATSTDGEGFIDNLLTHIPDFDVHGKKVTILGAGGSAKAIVEILLRQNPQSVVIANRTTERAQELRQLFGSKILIDDLQHLDLSVTDLLVNTTSQGMAGQPALNIDVSQLPSRAVVADIVYVPLKTDLLKSAESRGLRTVPGLGMLLHQAVRGFELWFGQKPMVTPELYDLVARNIEPDLKP